MNTLKNKIQLIGRLGKNPDVKTLDSGKKVAKFSLATNEVYYNNKGEKVEDTQWHNIVIWNKLATTVENYLERGSEIAIEGKLTHRDWEDANGNKHYTSEIVASELLMLGSK